MNKIEQIAKICHQANKTLCETFGDFSQKDWDEAPEWQKQSAIKGVEFHLKNPNSQPSDSHDSWMKEKIDSGWKFGPIKDIEKKEHPCIVPYEQLPKQQKSKDYLFLGIVRAIEQSGL